MTRLLGRRGNRSPNSAPNDGKDLQSLPQRHASSPEKDKSRHPASGSFCSKQSFMMLVLGLLTGYVILPVFLIETKLESSFGRMSFPQHDEQELEAYPGASRSLLPDANVVLQRLVEDRDAMAHQSLPTSRAPDVMTTKVLPDHQRMKILVTGGAGFVGSHLVDKLMMNGHEVIVVDNFFTGQKKNVAHWLHHPNFRFVLF